MFGRAVDIELHLGAPKDDPAKFYRELGEWWEQQGGTWGGRWTDLYPQAPGVPGAAGDVLHFQWTPAPLTTGVPDSLWPKGATCDVVQSLADLYLSGRGAPLELPPGPAIPPSSSTPAKKKAELPGLWFWFWGRLLQARISGHVNVAHDAPTLTGEL